MYFPIKKLDYVVQPVAPYFIAFQEDEINQAPLNRAILLPTLFRIEISVQILIMVLRSPHVLPAFTAIAQLATPQRRSTTASLPITQVWNGILLMVNQSLISPVFRLSFWEATSPTRRFKSASR